MGLGLDSTTVRLSNYAEGNTMRVISAEGDEDRVEEGTGASQQPNLAEVAESQAKNSEPLATELTQQISRPSGHGVDPVQHPRPNDVAKPGPSSGDHLASNLKLTITLNWPLEPSASNNRRSPGTPLQSDWWRVPKPSTDFTAKWKSLPDPGPSQRAPGLPSRSDNQKSEGAWQENHLPTTPQRLQTVYARHSVSRNLVRLEKVFTSRDYPVSCLSLASLTNLGIPYVHERLERIPNPRGGFFQPLGYAPLSLYLPCARLFCVEVSVLPESPLPEVGDLVLGDPDLSRILEGERLLGQSLRS